MSTALFRQIPLKRVPLVRYSALTKRENRIKVQLLKDFPQYGQKGEIIEVLPGLMRNRLYPKNGAAYIIPEAGLGPRIPVVKKDLRLQQQQHQQQLKQQQAEQAQMKAAAQTLEKTKTGKINPIDIEGLLFGAIPEGDAKAKPSSGYSMITLNVTLGTLRFGLEGSTVTKTMIAQKISSVVGFTVPESDLRITQGKDTVVEEIKSEGTYDVTITQEGSQSSVTKKVVVNA